ncbi:MAG: hypothetical protein Q9218_005519 [Villophora microphyllina]
MSLGPISRVGTICGVVNDETLRTEITSARYHPVTNNRTYQLPAQSERETVLHSEMMQLLPLGLPAGVDALASALLYIRLTPGTMHHALSAKL